MFRHPLDREFLKYAAPIRDSTVSFNKFQQQSTSGLMWILLVMYHTIFWQGINHFQYIWSWGARRGTTPGWCSSSQELPRPERGTSKWPSSNATHPQRKNIHLFHSVSNVIEIPSNNRPPVGCLQYNTASTGRITTFNFDSDSVHLANQQYSYCIRDNAIVSAEFGSNSSYWW